MKWIDFFVRKSRVERELESEISFHLESVIQEKIASGMHAEVARREALIEFGGAEQAKEDCRRVHRVASIENTWSNLKAAARFLRKSPGCSLTVILTLALGIGANSAVFSAIDTILLRPLAFPSANELVVLHQYNRARKNPRGLLAPVRLQEWNRKNSTFQAISGWYTENVSEISGALPERLLRADVAPRFLQVLGVSPALGRDFTQAELHFGGPWAALISDRLCRRRFHGDPHTIGKTLRVDSWSLPIVGVMPPGFAYPSKDVDLWLPVPMDAPYAQDRNSGWFTAIGHLKPGVSIASARADLDTVQARLAHQFPKTDRDLTPEVEPLKETIVSGSRRSLWILFGSVSLLLLIACTNIAALLLSRIADRAREISIRYSLGASRTSVVAQLLTEALVLALLGGALGLAAAGGAVRVFHAMAKALPRAEEIALDWHLALYTLACALLATLLFGMAPALIASRRSLSSSLASNSRTQVSARAPLQWSLVGAQIALAVTLLIGAGLLLRSFEEIGRVLPGFDASHVLTLRVSGNYGETAQPKKMYQRLKRTLETLSATPGVEAAAIAVSLPGASDGWPVDITSSDSTASPDVKMSADGKVVYGRYFETMRIPLLQGSSCQDGPQWTTVVVNRSFVDSYFPGQRVIGHHLAITPNPYRQPPTEIIGVAGDAREDGLNHPPVPTLYWCSTNGMPDPYFLIRTHGDPLALAPVLRQRVHQIEPNRSVFDVAPLEQHLLDSTAENRFRTLLLSLFALTAIALAAIGLYGTLSYLVSLRSREIGLRMALGALPTSIRSRFVMQGVRVSLLGCLAGMVIGAGVSRLLAGMLYGVSRTDTTTYVAVGIGVLALAALASVIPAHRAARVDPIQALRCD
ncbi:MAG TPA: ABC transporter permease [Bryobacteraceae bacterium]|jgi:putative ABC transport system permease protein